MVKQVFVILTSKAVKATKSSYTKPQSRRQYAQFLIKLEKARIHLEFCNDELTKNIREVLAKYDPRHAEDLSRMLEQEDNVYGNGIVQRHPIFKGVAISRRNSNAQKQTIDDVIKGLKKIHSQKLTEKVFLRVNDVSIKRSYHEFDEQYQRLVKLYLKSKDTAKDGVEEIANNSVMLGQTLEELLNSGDDSWSSTVKHGVIELMAHIFAIWTLNKSSDYFKASKTDRKKFLMQPKPAQVVSLLCMFGNDSINWV